MSALEEVARLVEEDPFPVTLVRDAIIELSRRIARLEQDKSLREGAVAIEGPAAVELLRRVQGREDDEEGAS